MRTVGERIRGAMYVKEVRDFRCFGNWASEFSCQEPTGCCPYDQECRTGISVPCEGEVVILAEEDIEGLEEDPPDYCRECSARGRCGMRKTCCFGDWREDICGMPKNLCELREECQAVTGADKGTVAIMEED